MYNNTFRLLQNQWKDELLLKEKNINNNINSIFVVRNNLTQANVNSSSSIKVFGSSTFTGLSTIYFQYFEKLNEIQTQTTINQLVTKDVKFINSKIIVDNQLNTLSTINSLFELNSNCRLLEETGLIFKQDVDGYLEEKRFVYNRSTKSFSQYDETGTKLKIQFDKSIMENIFIKKTGDTMMGNLMLRDIRPSDTHPKLQQNLTYFYQKINPKLSHDHVQYIRNTGELAGDGEGTIQNYLTLRSDPSEIAHQVTKKYIDDTTSSVISAQHQVYINQNTADTMNLGQQLSCDKSPTQTNHQQTLQYQNTKYTSVISQHNHDNLYVSTTSANQQTIGVIPRLTDDFKLYPKDDSSHSGYHIASKQYSDYWLNKHLGGSLFITFQNYYMGTCFSNNDITENETVSNGLYRLKFDFSDWYTEFNLGFKEYMDTTDDFNPNSFVVIPIITPTSFEMATSEKVNDESNRNWFNDDTYYDVKVENIQYPVNNNKYILQFDIGVIGIDINGGKTQSPLAVPEREHIPMQSFTIIFIGGPSNSVFNMQNVPDTVCEMQNVVCNLNS